MSKRKTNEIKDNNISSKLLGANLSDINIEKFRDSHNKMPVYEVSGKFSIPLLKTISNKFSPLVIFTITLPKQAISSIDPISQCENLMILNLSSNSIENISSLRKLTKLRILNISDNNVISIESLSRCKELTNLHMEQNMIKSNDQINPLKQCPILKNVHFQTLGGNKQNPLCSLNNYRENIIEDLPQIKRLDSIPTSIVNFNNGSEIKNNKKKEIKIDMKSIGPFYTNKFPSVNAFTPPSFNEQTSLKKSIGSCKSLIQQLEAKMRSLMSV